MSTAPAQPIPDLATLDAIQRRVLWLAVRMVDAANRERPNTEGLKVGGHQASSASMVTLMTALYFAHLDAADRVSVKPHASPVLHAINYLLGNLDRSYLTRLRAYGGLQSYPSRTKDPDRVDFSTGSVGLGAAAPLFGAVTRRYVDAHFGPRPPARFIALLGDAELDEGNIWEAIADPATQGLGNVTWVVDFNRQSLDRVVPGVRIGQWSAQFQAAGWHVVELRFGGRLTELFARPGGDALRRWIEGMSNEHYQSLFALTPAQARARFTEDAPAAVVDLLADLDDEEVFAAVTDLGGHDLASLLDAFAECDRVTDRPSVIFAYTVKGWGLPIAGNPRNHSQLLGGEQIAALRGATGLADDTEWDRFDAASAEGIWCNRRQEALRLEPAPRRLAVTVPEATGAGRAGRKPVSTQEVFGRTLVDLSRQADLAPYLVSTAPDVATSTNLAGFINRMGVFHPVEQRAWSVDPALKWTESPKGQHIELGISEMNLFLLLGQLGLAWDLSHQPLIPIGTVYDPFVLRGLDAFVYSVYSGARFIVAGTPSGVTLAPEGGAHQSTVTPSVGLELPGVTLVEPAYGTALDWLLCDAVGHIAAGGDAPTTAAPAEAASYYFRLSTRPIDQAPFEAARQRLGDVVLRRQVLAGAYRLLDPYEAAPHLRSRPGGEPAPSVVLAASGAVLPEVLAAAAELMNEGVAAHVVDVTSADRLYSAWQRTLRQGIRTATTPSAAGALRAAFGGTRGPVVTIHDGASHAMAWLGAALGVHCVPLGVDSFGQSGTIADLYRAHDLDSGSIVNAALAALELSYTAELTYHRPAAE
ncbi:pyruvate dehydrogenase [Polymorphospora rubra]|uniref:transketolase-like TK C-terminal-containing protein n=1 Tax=Polymorphospora rubra TaxID=338584 RepID=UPI0033D596A8